MGAHYKENRSLGTEQDVNVTEIIVHENYDPRTNSHDIALLKLATPVLIGPGVGTVCLPKNKNSLPIDHPTKRCCITGWGTLSAGGSQPDKLYEACVPLVSRRRCGKAYKGIGKINKSMLCAGLDEGGIDTCQGDSGGPLVCEFSGQWHLEGVTSWGYGCAFPKMYGVYAKVRYLKSWIKSKLGKILSLRVSELT